MYTTEYKSKNMVQPYVAAIHGAMMPVYNTPHQFSGRSMSVQCPIRPHLKILLLRDSMVYAVVMQSAGLLGLLTFKRHGKNVSQCKELSPTIATGPNWDIKCRNLVLHKPWCSCSYHQCMSIQAVTRIIWGAGMWTSRKKSRQTDIEFLFPLKTFIFL